MPVIVNELEIIVEAPPAPASEGPPAGPPPLPPGPLELNELLERRLRLARRLFAH